MRTLRAVHSCPSAIPYGSGRFLKEANREAIMRYVRERPGMSRTDLAERANLAKATVSDLVNELIGDGWLVENEFTGRRIAGRLPRPIALDAQRRRLLGCQINEATAVVTALTLTGELTELKVCDVAGKAPAEIFDQLGMQIAEVSRKLAHAGVIVSGIGLSVPGPIHPSSGVLLFSDHAGWKQLPVRDMFTDCLSRLDLAGLPMLVARAANCAAQRHFEAEAVPEDESVLYVHVGQGIAASIIAGGQPILGANGCAGAISHLQLVPGGATCACGKQGCANVSVTLKAMQQSLGMTERALYEHYAVRDARVVRVVEDVAHGIANVIHELCLAYDPARIFVGGHVLHLGAQFQHAVRDGLAAFAGSTAQKSPSLKFVHFDEHDAARGAAMLMLRSSLARSLYARADASFDTMPRASANERVSFAAPLQWNAA